MRPTGRRHPGAATSEPAGSLAHTCEPPLPSGESPLEPSVGVLLGREQARHHDEWVATRRQLRGALDCAPDELVAQLERDLTAAAAAAITALQTVRTTAAGDVSFAEGVSTRAEQPLATATAALRSALASHLALEAQLRASQGQVS